MPLLCLKKKKMSFSHATWFWCDYQNTFLLFLTPFPMEWGFPDGSEVKASACNAEDLGSIPGPGRSLGEGNGNPLQYSCLENPMGGGAWWAIVHRVAKSRTRLSDFTHFPKEQGTDPDLTNCVPPSADTHLNHCKGKNKCHVLLFKNWYLI